MSSIQSAGRALLDRLDARAVPDSLSRCWLALPPQAPAEWVWRVRRDRVDIVPWLDRTRPLRGASVVEVGAGRGASTFALCEQGAQVTAYDIDQPGLDEAAAHLGAAGLAADLRCENATALADLALATLDWVMFWASLEHMVHTERIAAIRGAWAALRPGGLLTVVETPNRLWPHDSHTSQLPFYNWLPDDLAFDSARFSGRPGFGGTHYSRPAEEMLDFRRRGRGVSVHEFRLALDDQPADVVSCLQLDRRRRNPLRRLAWAVGAPGRTVRCLQRYEPGLHAAWLQPFLYLTLRKPS